MNTNQADLLDDLEEKKRDNNILTAVIVVYALQIFAFVVYYLWPFGLKTLLRAKNDSELHVLAIIHVIYPIIALTILGVKQRFGWAMILFGSLVNVAYGLVTYGAEMMSGDALEILATDRMIFFFIVYGVLAILLFRRSLLLRLDIQRRFVFWTVGVSATVVSLFLISLIMSY